ncbi:MAG: hypothetical protein QOF21_2959 [Actinomycetota bacterium]
MAEPVGFDVFMENALYGPSGFYAVGSGPGRRDADFLTSPEIGPLFGAVVARALDAWWDQLGRPDPFPVVEAGGGRGALARAVAAAAPRCADVMRYVLVERAAPARAEAARSLDVFTAESRENVQRTVTDDLPAPGELGDVGVVIANELLDNLVFKLLERAGGEWIELLVDGDEFVPGEAVSGFDHVDAPDGSRIPWHTGAIEWTARARQLFARSRIALIDYGTRTTGELALRPWRDWLRTYRDHGGGTDPLRRPGDQDITCDIAFDQLQPDRLTTQAEWLHGYGIEGFVGQAKATWHERAAIGDLLALAARSRVSEADALLDPTGPGGFLVAEWLPA